MSALSDVTLAEAAAALDSGRVSSQELVEEALQQISRLGPLNAFLNVQAEQARQQARQLDEERQRGIRRSPLHGIPMACKDMFYRQGVPSSCGSRVQMPLPSTTACVLQRLDEAGAVQMGVLNMAEFAFNPTGHNTSMGHCRNPWDPSRITGGSSSGSAVAVATRAVWAALGSDTGASIRLPAALNGVTGLKPTYGRVSRAGAMGLSFTLDTIGPLAQSAQDIALVMDAIAGPDPMDPTTAGLAKPQFASGVHSSVRGLRVGIPSAYFHDGVDGGIARLLAQSQQTLKELGCELVEVNIDEQDLSAANAAATLVLAVESATLHAAWLREQGARYTPQVRARLERGFAISGPQYLDALRYRALALDKFLATVFARVDVLHTPVTPILTPDLVATDMPAGPELDRLHGLLTRCLRPMNFLGLPALSLPIGFLPDGMPSAMQLIGRPFDEPLLLNLGHAYQQATDWHRQRPPLPDAESAASPAP